MSKFIQLSNSKVSKYMQLPVVESIDLNSIIGTNLEEIAEGYSGINIYKLSGQGSDTEIFDADTWNYESQETFVEVGQDTLPYHKITAGFTVNDGQAATMSASGIPMDLYNLKMTIASNTMTQKFNRLLLFGNDNTTQGIVNNASKTVPLNPDSAGNSVQNYIPSELLKFIMGLVRDVTANSYSTAVPTTILGTHEFIATLQTAIVDLTSFQNSGAGTGTVATAIGETLQMSYGGYKLNLVAASYMKGAGDLGKDRFMVIAPNVNPEYAAAGNIENVVADFRTKPEQYDDTPVGRNKRYYFELYSSTAMPTRPEAVIASDYTY